MKLNLDLDLRLLDNRPTVVSQLSQLQLPKEFLLHRCLKTIHLMASKSLLNDGNDDHHIRLFQVDFLLEEVGVVVEV